MDEPRMEPVGKVERFFAHPSVAVIALTAPLAAGERIYVKGHTTDFQQTVDSMQRDHAPVPRAEAGQEVGIKVTSRCRPHDIVYRLIGV